MTTKLDKAIAATERAIANTNGIDWVAMPGADLRLVLDAAKRSVELERETKRLEAWRSWLAEWRYVVGRHGHVDAVDWQAFLKAHPPPDRKASPRRRRAR